MHILYFQTNLIVAEPTEKSRNAQRVRVYRYTAQGSRRTEWIQRGKQDDTQLRVLPIVDRLGCSREDQVRGLELPSLPLCVC